MRQSVLVCLGAGVLAPFPCAAQEAPPVPSSTNAAPACQHAIPALTPIVVETLVDLGSAVSRSLDTFPIRLAEPVVVDGHEVLPAGSTGEGEVVHAKKSGGSGTPGELVLAARWLDACGTRLRLRSMHVALAGQGAVATVNAINAGAALAPVPIGLVGFAIRGRNVLYPAGTRATAKIAVRFEPPAPILEDQDLLPTSNPDAAVYEG